MKNKLPKTKLEFELTCDKIFLLQQVKRLKIHLQATQQALQEVLNGKASEN